VVNIEPLRFREKLGHALHGRISRENEERLASAARAVILIGAGAWLGSRVAIDVTPHIEEWRDGVSTGPRPESVALGAYWGGIGGFITMMAPGILPIDSQEDMPVVDVPEVDEVALVQ
jgi:hypothetical protein